MSRLRFHKQSKFRLMESCVMRSLPDSGQKYEGKLLRAWVWDVAGVKVWSCKGLEICSSNRP